MAGNNEVLGPEWGNLAGLPAKQALEYVSQYAADLEDQVAAAKPKDDGRGGESGEENDDEPSGDKPSGLDIARQMNRQSKQPLGAEFVGRRESARTQARRQIEQLGYDWLEVSDAVETVMANVPAEQQVNKDAWVEAFLYVHGRADAARRAQRLQQGEPVDDEPVDQSPPRTVQDRVIASPANADRGSRRTPDDRGQKARIEDPVERRTKGQFEKVLGRDISDEEWIALSQEAEIVTYEDYQRLQDELESRKR